MSEVIYKSSVEEVYSADDLKEFGIRELTQRVEKRDKKESMSTALTIVLGILSMIISCVVPSILPPFDKKNTGVLCEYVVCCIIIAIIYIVAYIIVKCIHSIRTETAGKFAEDFIEYFSLTPRERIRKDKQKRKTHKK